MSPQQTRAVWLTVLCASLTIACTPRLGSKRSTPSGQKHTLRFHRPFAVGERFRLIVTGEKMSQTAVNGKVLAIATRQSNFDYEAIVTIKAVSSIGKSIKEEHRVIRCWRMNRGRTTSLLAKDAVLTAEVVGGKKRFSVGGKAVSKTLASFLGDLVEVDTSDKNITDDDIMGGRASRAPGDTWALNRDKLHVSISHELKNLTLTPKSTDVSGTVRFVGLKRHRGHDGMLFSTKATINNFAPSAGRAKVVNGTIGLEVRGWLPWDLKVKTLDVGAIWTLRVEAQTVFNGVKSTIVTMFVIAQNREQRPVK